MSETITDKDKIEQRAIELRKSASMLLELKNDKLFFESLKLPHKGICALEFHGLASHGLNGRKIIRGEDLDMILESLIKSRETKISAIERVFEELEK